MLLAAFVVIVIATICPEGYSFVNGFGGLRLRRKTPQVMNPGKMDLRSFSFTAPDRTIITRMPSGTRSEDDVRQVPVLLRGDSPSGDQREVFESIQVNPSHGSDGSSTVLMNERSTSHLSGLATALDAPIARCCDYDLSGLAVETFCEDMFCSHDNGRRDHKIQPMCSQSLLCSETGKDPEGVTTGKTPHQIGKRNACDRSISTRSYVPNQGVRYRNTSLSFSLSFWIFRSEDRSPVRCMQFSAKSCTSQARHAHVCCSKIP